jgi:hypothetical protein
MEASYRLDEEIEMSSSRWFCGWFVYRVGKNYYATKAGASRLTASSNFGIRRQIVARRREECLA